MKANAMCTVRYLCSFALGFFILSAHADDFVSVPPFHSFVTDKVGMLDASQHNSLENFLKAYETRTGSQIGILLISSTAPEVIEQYSIRVADAWKLGRQGIDDGVILIVAKDNPKSLRRLRIEAGRGVQGTLTDAQSKRILQDVIAPHFRSNDYYGGLMAGVLAITNLLDQENLPAVNEKLTAKTMQSRPSIHESGDLATYFIAGILIVGCIGILIFALYIVYKIWRLIVFVLSKFIKFSPSVPEKKSKKKSSRRRNSNSGFQISFDSSSSSSSSSSSGGGGSFDGGGASGDW